MTHRGPFQTLLFCDSVTLGRCRGHFCSRRGGVSLGRAPAEPAVLC